MLQELNLCLATPCFPQELLTCPRGANRVLETSLELAAVLVCALNLSSASVARPLAGRGGDGWDESGGCGRGHLAGHGRAGAGSCSSTVKPQGRGGEPGGWRGVPRAALQVEGEEIGRGRMRA